jgi:hypothetical protein
MAESITAKPGALAAMRPHFRLPAQVRAPMLLAVPVLIAAWSLAGFYGSLGPTLVRKLVGGDSLALGGAVLFVIGASGALSVLYLHARPARTMMMFGTIALFAGVGSTLIAIAQLSALGFFAGSAVAGVGFGAGFQGAIRTVMPLAAAHERAGVLSIIYVVAYLAMGLPAVLAGVGVVYGGGLLATSHQFGLMVMLLAAGALLATRFGRSARA